MDRLDAELKPQWDISKCYCGGGGGDGWAWSFGGYPRDCRHWRGRIGGVACICVVCETDGTKSYCVSIAQVEFKNGTYVSILSVDA